MSLFIEEEEEVFTKNYLVFTGLYNNRLILLWIPKQVQ